MLIANIGKFRARTGMPVETIASHGEYVNLRVKMSNDVLVDERVRREAGILFEAYDKPLADAVTCRLADQVLMDRFVAEALGAIMRREPVILLLTHPRQWHSAALVNAADNLNRLMKGIYFKV